MALHQIIQRILLIGARIESLPPAPTPQAPPALLPLIESIAGAHKQFDERALHFGHRYRSGFWAIYLLSAIAVLFAIMPLALGWDSANHALHPYSGLWPSARCWSSAPSAPYTRWGIGAIGRINGCAPAPPRNSAGTCPCWRPCWTSRIPPATPIGILRVFDPGQHLRGADDVAALCAANEPLARRLLASAWSDSDFVASYARWTMDILQQQRHYHYRIAGKQHALLHRVHRVTAALFGLTALGALLHLVIHTLWLSVVTTFFPHSAHRFTAHWRNPRPTA